MKRYYFLPVLGILLFLCGVAVGQVENRPKFSKYQEPASITKADWLLLQAEIAAIEWHSSFREGVSTPHFLFVPEINKFVAVVLVDRTRLDKEPANVVRNSLMDSEAFIQASFENSFPEITNGDFEVQFKTIGGDIYAEYKNGELTVR